ncbi:hypothetical protein MHZ92_08365 [Sporosarcina sp. ACRSL]|uniref:hypothetical protein n=1 Tax=Sporosarcina sp. ACRSL TaxID=2918215 RepID=UPI001EF4256A|nr:hypothetical protein [Sporosarcina sp. ACRSL]MCG7344143.1 hypothetical protein [Sporosarcina sp. ACRSL]
MRQPLKILITALFIALLLVGCTKETDQGEAEAAKTPDEDVVTSEEENAEESVEGETDEEEEIEIIKPAEHLGGMDIEFSGTASIEGGEIKVEGQTNLLEGTKLYIDMNWVEGVLIGGNRTAIVERDGSFTYETKLPDKVDGLITMEVKFEPASQNKEIKEHYGESGENLEGPFIRQYDYKMKEIVYHKASAIVVLPREEGLVEVEITPPNWNKPDDYGSTTIRIEPTKVVKDEQYIYVDGESNLLEGTNLRGRAILPGYITSGFIGHTNVNPDGSFSIIFENPETDSRIKNLDEYEITIETNMSNTLFATAVEKYGEDGEKMTGDLVEEEGNGKKAIVRIQERKE